MHPMTSFVSPQLERIHRGKVRDSFRIDRNRRLVISTDRLSAFDRVLATPIPGKGAILNSLSAFWFEQTRDIVPNHFVRIAADRAMVVEEATPIRVEMIVRAFLAGSAWRAYRSGRRTLSGVDLPDGLERNARFREPIVTPTTKEAHDTEIAAQDIVRAGLATKDAYRRMETAALALFARGTELLRARGLLLVDTKYEFGLRDDEVILIDEVHTPDSSRFWNQEAYERDPQSVEAWDKEYVRRWLLEQEEGGLSPDALPDEIVEEMQRRYAELYERVTGEQAPPIPTDATAHTVSQLVAANLMRDACVTVVMGSSADRKHAIEIAGHLEGHDVAVRLRVASAHKSPSYVEALARELSESAEPGAVIAVAGLSNGLGGALAANTNLPVINCPPFVDRTDILLNLGSSIMMPSSTPAMTVLKPQNAAQAALRCLGLTRLRRRMSADIEERRTEIRRADDTLRGTGS